MMVRHKILEDSSLQLMEKKVVVESKIFEHYSSSWLERWRPSSWNRLRGDEDDIDLSQE